MNINRSYLFDRPRHGAFYVIHSLAIECIVQETPARSIVRVKTKLYRPYVILHTLL